MLGVSERRYRGAVIEPNRNALENARGAESGPDAVVLFGPGGGIRHAGPAGDRLLGYEPGTLTGADGFGHLHPDDRDRVRAAFGAHLADPTVAFAESFRVRHWSGTWRWLEARGVNLLHEPGIGAAVVTYRDVTRHREVEGALRSAMEWSLDAVYVLACDRAPDGRVADFVFTSVNRNGADLVALAPARMVGQRLCELLPVNRTGGFFDKYVRVVETGEPLEEDFPITTGDGRNLWLHHQVVRAGDGIAIITRDVTARKGAEEALRRSEELLRTVIAHIPCAVFWKDLDSVYLGCNDLFARNHGLPGAAAAVGHTDFELGTPAPEADFFRACDRRVMESGEALLGFEEPLTRADGARTVLLTSKVPLRDGTGAVVGVLGVYQDITERKRVEDELGEWKARYEAAVKATGQVLYDWDVGTNRLTWGGDSEGTLGYRESELPDALAGWTALVHPEDREPFEHEAERCARARSPFRMEYRVRGRGGSYVTVHDQGHFIPNPSGALTERMVGFVSDVSERKRLEAQVRQSQKMDAVGQLAGGVAHDFNNLLTIINGYAAIQLTTLAPDDPMYPMVQEVREAGLRARDLTRQLLAFGRQQVLQPVVLDLNEALQEVTQMLRRLIGEDVELVTVAASDVLRVRADPGQIGQVLMNLAVNARDAMPTGGALTVETRNVVVGGAPDGREVPPGRYAVLSVTDTGTGMSDEVKNHIFEPFFTTKDPGKGTGLGLATVYGIVKQSGGHIEVETAPERGTTFRVYLPGFDAPVGADQRADGGAAPAGGETVLLVEDDARVRKLTHRLLQQLGYTVLVAGGTEEALRVAAESPAPVDLLLTDVVMPGANGRVLAERLAARCPGVRVVFMSGYTDDAVVRHGVEYARVNFLHKPFSPEALGHKVREVLDTGEPFHPGPPGTHS